MAPLQIHLLDSSVLEDISDARANIGLRNVHLHGNDATNPEAVLGLAGTSIDTLWSDILSIIELG